jgi:hypothetical protein|tara:strand:- start:248 stop:619 length:372 start_codon:yes stop_codon:yes gene_type:complete
MAYGLIGTGRGMASSAKAGFSKAAGLEQSREMMQTQLEQAASAQKKSMIGTTAGLGAQYGMSQMGGQAIAGALGTGGTMAGATGLAGAGAAATGSTLATAGAAAGPWGALIGAGIGLLIGEMF